MQVGTKVRKGEVEATVKWVGRGGTVITVEGHIWRSEEIEEARDE